MSDASEPTAGEPGGRGPAHPPFQIERVVGTSFRTFFANLVPFLTIAAILESPLIAVNFYGMSTRVPGPPSFASALTSLGTFVLAVITHNVATGTLLFGVFKSLRHQPVGWSECLMQGLRKFPAIFGTSIVVGLAAALGLIFCVVPGLYVIAVYAAAVPATVVEGKGVFAAMARSKDLTNGRRWPVFGSLFLAGIVTGVPAFVVLLLVAANPVLQLTLTSAWQIVSVAFQAVLSSVLYYQLRESREDLDATELAAVFD